MLKSLILIALSLNITFAVAKSRFSDVDKAKFLEEVKQAVAAHKIENKGKVDLQIMKPAFNEELDYYYKQEKFTREEMVQLKQQYEDFAKSNPANAEEAFNKFVHDKLEEINKTPVQKIKEGGVCNNWSCDEGLKCAPDPKQEDGPKCKKESRECKEDSDCCSGSCTLNTKTKKRSCEDVYRCFRPLLIGQSCMQNPVCGEGECLPFNSKTSGIGECEDRGHSCKKNSDCCSNACSRNKCIESYICKDCVKAGKKPERGQKCCEGLLPNDKNICVPDVPPVVIPQVRVRGIEKSIVAKISDLFISKANADEAYDTVNADHDTYSNFQAKSADVDKVEVAPPKINLSRKSNFDTCDIRFRDDYIKFLQKPDIKDPTMAGVNLLNLELAFLSFDYVMTGDGVNDYWTRNNVSMYSRLKSIAKDHVELRKKTNARLDEVNRKLTCMCLDVKGYKNITDPDKKAFFETCPEFQSAAVSSTVCKMKKACSANDAEFKYTDASGKTVVHADACQGGFMDVSCDPAKDGGACTCTAETKPIDDVNSETASSIKGKRLLIQYTQNLQSFTASLTVDNTALYKRIADVSMFAANEAKWNEAENKKYTLFNFNIKNPSGSVAAMGAILGALLAAGVIAILGGFATTSILTTWAAAGIIATSAITGGTGLWLIASLKGAWISKRPEVFDKYIRSYGCGKKETCVEYSRELNQPYNNICNVHTSANACIKNFVVYYQGDEPRYVVDPWIPYGIDKNLILRDAHDEKDYAHKLEDGFQAAKNAMISKNPGASGGGGKDGGAFVSENYMRELFIDGSILGSYTPKIGTDDRKYILDDSIIKLIKDGARKYAIESKFFQEGDEENLKNFADYTFEYHFKWPKTSRAKEISYPTVGLATYLDIMSNGVAGTMAVGAGSAAKSFGNLNALYLQDYLNTLQLYKDQPINQDPSKMKLINAEIDKAQSDLDQQKTLNALSNSSMDSMLENLNAGTIGTAAKGVGAKGNVTLTSDQSSFLNAIGNLRSTRKEQLKKLDNFNKTMAASGNADRAARISSAFKKFASNFTRPTSGAISPRGAGIFGSGGLDGVGLKTTTDDSKKSDGKNSGNGSGFGNFGGSFGGSIGSSYRGSSGKGSGDQNAATDANANSAQANANDEDARRLQEAIEARDRANKDKYASKEEQTIFEKVTNAYIRNYDKVLTKKKDKDVPEQK